MYIEDILIEKTLKLGTKIESYLGNFYDYIQELNSNIIPLDNNLKKFSNFKNFLEINNKGIKKRTIEQNKGVFEIFDILKNKEEFNEIFLSFNDFNDFKNILLKKLQFKINNYHSYLDNKYFLSILTKILINKKILSRNNYNKKIIDYLKFFDLQSSEKGYDSLFKDCKVDFSEKDFIENIQKAYKIYLRKIEKKENKFKKLEIYSKEEKISELNGREISVINLLNFLKEKMRFKDFNIPFYQRRYVWDEINIKMLFYSILEKDIFLNLNSIHINIEHSKIYLVDGQQRLTSLIIFLLNLWKEENIIFLIKNNIIDDLDFKLIKKNMNYYFELLKQNFDLSDNEFEVIFKNSTLNKRKNNKKSLLYANFEFINKILEDYSKEEKINILYKILGIEFILVSEQDTDHVLKFVELNSNSKSLTNYELSKSYLIFFSKKIGFKYKIKEKIIYFENKFNKNGKLNQKEIDIFLSSYLKIKMLKNIKDSDYFLSFKKYIEEKNNIESLINDLSKYLNYFLVVRGNSLNNSDNKKMFDFLSDILFTFKKQNIYLPILMYFLNLININHNNNLNNKNIHIFLLKLEIFHFKWKIVNFRGDSLSEVMLSLLKNIKREYKNELNLNYCFEQDNVNFIKDVLSISNDQFVKDLEKFEFKDNDLALKIIVRMENCNEKKIFEKKDQNNLITLNYNSLTLEHIYPQKANNKIEEMEKTKNNLLNLIFLTKELNSSLKNSSPYDKYDDYKKFDVFKYNKSLSDFKDDKKNFEDDFIFNTLKERQEKLIKAYKKFLSIFNFI